MDVPSWQSKNPQVRIKGCDSLSGQYSKPRARICSGVSHTSHRQHAQRAGVTSLANSRTQSKKRNPSLFGYKKLECMPFVAES
ncbi:hypothetical protein Tco_0573247 [Tanacetum coccineum]